MPAGTVFLAAPDRLRVWSAQRGEPLFVQDFSLGWHSSSPVQEGLEEFFAFVHIGLKFCLHINNTTAITLTFVKVVL